MDKDIKISIILAVANTIWFGFWFLIIFTKNLSPWWFLFPAIMHWTYKDLTGLDPVDRGKR